MSASPIRSSGTARPTSSSFGGFTGDLLSAWDEPLLVRHLEGLASNGRLLVLDKRGTGLSDRVTGVPTIETRMDDVRAVMDAEGSHQAVLWSGQEGTHVTTFFAATYPERTLGLVLLDPSARATPSDDYPWAAPESEWMERLNDVRANWGKREFFLRLLEERAPDAADDPAFQDWFVTHMRRSLSPGAAAAYFRTAMDADISDVLPAVRVPTLILFSPAQRGPAEFFAGRIPDARIQELPGMRGDFTWIDDATHERTMQLVREFVASLQHVREPDRILATLLFTDIVDSTKKQAELGDRGWSDLVRRHRALVRDLRRAVPRHRAGHGRRRLLRALRRTGPGGGVCPGDRARRPVTRDRGARRLAHGRVRRGRREVLRPLRVDRRARGIARGNGRDRRVPDREGPGGGLGPDVRTRR